MKRATVMIRAKVSVTEEPDAGKLHVRVCAGAPGNGRSYCEMRKNLLRLSERTLNERKLFN